MDLTAMLEYPNLRPLLEPRSIAIIGASEDVTKPAGLPLYFALKHSYQGRLYPVNPKRKTIQGLRCYPDVKAIPEEVEAALIVVPAAVVAGVLRDCAEKGIKAAVIPVSGFAELGGEGDRRQEEINEIARAAGIRICGPNTNGLLNVHGKVSLGYSYAQEIVSPGRLAYVTQSGALLSASVPRLAEQGIGFSYFVASGNQADLESFDFARYLLDDPHTDVIALYIEGLKNPAKFLDVAELALKKKKPLVVIKVGRSETAAQAALSHTGSLVGSDAVFEAVCRQKGLIRVDDFDKMIAAALVLLNCPRPKGNRVGLVSTSGGAMSLLADHFIDHDIVFPELSGATVGEAEKVIPAYGRLKNPFDIGAAGATATRKPELSHKAVELLARDENVDILLAAVTPIDPRGTLNFISAVVDVAKSIDKPVLLFCPMGRLREAETKVFESSGLPLLSDAADCTVALEALIRFAQKTEQTERPRPPTESLPGAKLAQIRRRLKAAGPVLSERQTKELLAAYGIETTREESAGSLEEALRIADRIGYPVALKVDSAELSHKTEIGAVRLNIAGPEELETAYLEMVDRLTEHEPTLGFEGVLVQEMVPAGREVIIGLSRDAHFGPTILFGLGGVFVEALGDVSLRVAPLSGSDAVEMIREIRGHQSLEAFRGRPRADIESVVSTLLKLSRLALDLGDLIAELDVNPLIVFEAGQGVKAVDALARLRPSKEETVRDGDLTAGRTGRR